MTGEGDLRLSPQSALNFSRRVRGFELRRACARGLWDEAYCMGLEARA